jgi:hypothetical protein
MFIDLGIKEVTASEPSTPDMEGIRCNTISIKKCLKSETEVQGQYYGGSQGNMAVGKYMVFGELLYQQR